jgi:hypothetical protein
MNPASLEMNTATTHNITPSCIHVNYTPAQFPQLIKFIFAKLELVPFEGECGAGWGGGARLFHPYYIPFPISKQLALRRSEPAQCAR